MVENCFLDAEHFPKENVQHQMHLVLLCFLRSKKQRQCVHFVLLNIFQRKMFSITFSKGKCSAKQNVTNAFVTFYWCKNTFLQSQMYATHQMLFCKENFFSLHRRTFKMAPVEASHPRVNSGYEDYREIL